MPTQPSGGRRDLERRAADVLDPENRPESAGHRPTRRKVLSMVTGGIAATAAVGTAGASRRPTVRAEPGTCGEIVFTYRGRGPNVAIDIHGCDSPIKPLKPGRSMSHSVPAGTYDVTAHPVHSRGKASIPVVGPPIPVEACQVSVDASFRCIVPGRGAVNFDNSLDTCVAVRYEAYRNGQLQPDGSGVRSVSSNGNRDIPIDSNDHDEWFFWAYIPRSSGDCMDTGGELIQINDEPSPLHLKDVDC